MTDLKNELMVIGERVKNELVLSDYTVAEDYNMESALKAANIIFIENNNFKQCSPESKYRAVLDMMVQGLNPLKGQCAFIPYKNTLQCIRQYTGSIMVAKREDPRIMDVRAQVIRGDDTFDFEIVNGLYHINKHKPNGNSWDSEIVAAYAIAVDRNGNITDMDFMSIENMKNTWRNTKLTIYGKPVVGHDGTLNPESNHAKYPEMMCRKTVIQRLCRKIISSSPNEKLMRSIERSDEDNTIQDDIRIELNNEANRKMIDFPSNHVAKEEIIDTEPMATEEHMAQIKAAHKAANRSGNVMEDISGFVGRQINRIRELTAAEAENYIDAVSLDNNDSSRPAWGSK